MAAATLIGVDIGTGAVKAILIGLDGTVHASFSRPHPTARPEPGHVEQDPADWMAGVTAALARFAADHDLSGLCGIGLCSQVSTHAFVDAGGEPLMPAIVWQDGRCGNDAAALDARITAAEKDAWFGGPMPIDASHALARMAYVARTAPDLYARTRHVLLPKDYCALKLTGAVASDPVAAVGLVGADHAYLADLVALVPGAAEKLPPLADYTDCIGRVREGFPCAGTPVFVGAMDAWAAMFGVGVVRNGDAMYVSGTSDVLGVLSDRRAPEPGVIVFPRYMGITLHVAPTQSGGGSLAWLSTLLGRDADALSALAAATPVSGAVPLFLPHLEGERAPMWDIRSRGVFARMETATGPGELTRSVMEGVAFSARLAFEAAERSAVAAPGYLRIGGGGARSDAWCQIRADAFGRPLRRAIVPDAGTLGAAAIAGLGAGVLPSLEAAVDRLVSYGATFEPDPRWRGYYEAKFGKYQELYADLASFNHRFAGPS